MKSSLAGWLWAVLTVFLLAFIFGNSLQTAAESSAVSGMVIEMLEPILPQTAGSSAQRTFLIRKTAHFLEFTLLGFALCGTAHRFGMSHPRLCVCFAGAVTAAADELIQRFVEGRSAQLTDVLLDTAGVLFGLFLWLIVSRILARRSVKSVF